MRLVTISLLSALFMISFSIHAIPSTQSALNQPASPVTKNLNASGLKNLSQSPPIKIVIPAIKVSTTKFLKVGIDADGLMEVPKTASTVAWFTGSPSPGELGPSVIVGHVDMSGKPGVFFNLKLLKQGDPITVTRADGNIVKFLVTKIASYPKIEFPTEEVYGDIDYAGLRIITCGGAFDKKSKHYLSNIIVFAKMVA